MIVSAPERLRLHRIDETSLPPQIPPPIPQGLSSISSISSAAPSLDKLYATVSRPFLPIPQPYYMYRVLEIEREMSRIVEKEGRQIDGDIRNDLKRIEAFTLEKIALLRLHTEKLESKVKWSAWQTVTQYVAATTSIVIGSGCVATGAGSAAGAFLIASGALGLANRVASDTGAWQCMASLFTAEQSKQIKIATKIDQGLSALSVVLSIAGTFGAYNARALELLNLSRDPIMQKAALSLGALNSGLTLSMKAGEGLADKRQSTVLAELKIVDLTSNVLREGIKTNTAEVSKMIQHSEGIDTIIKDAISSSTL